MATHAIILTPHRPKTAHYAFLTLLVLIPFFVPPTWHIPRVPDHSITILGECGVVVQEDGGEVVPEGGSEGLGRWVRLFAIEERGVNGAGAVEEIPGC